jgi:hypothetical protein
VLYRAFPSLPGAGPTDEGGPLFVPRLDQGRGRHDNPDAYGALYLSRVPASPVAEVLRDYLARRIPPSPLLREGSPIALVTVAEDDLDLIDLDDPRRLYDEGASGLEWWSTIEASWINVTLFADRAVGRLSVVDAPESLTIDHPVVEAAAEAVGVVLR